jgi:hypothetical protein
MVMKNKLFMATLFLLIGSKAFAQIDIGSKALNQSKQ